MKRSLFLILLALACSKQSAPAPTSSEKTYPMTATIVSRDPSHNTVNLDNKEVPGVMEAMKMDYELRGTNVGTLPPDGTPVDVTLHERDGNYWVTDVRTKK